MSAQPRDNEKLKFMEKRRSNNAQREKSGITTGTHVNWIVFMAGE